MIFRTAHRVAFHTRKLLFWLEHGKRFGQFDLTSTIYRPLRLAGHADIYIGKRVFVHSHGWLEAFSVAGSRPALRIGSHTVIGNTCQIVAAQELVIEESVLIADGVFIADNDHEYRDVTRPILSQGSVLRRPVRIGSGAWIGRNAAVLANVGRNSVVAANSVVLKDVPDYTVVGGNPARPLKAYNLATQQWEPLRPAHAAHEKVQDQ